MRPHCNRAGGINGVAIPGEVMGESWVGDGGIHAIVLDGVIRVGRDAMSTAKNGTPSLFGGRIDVKGTSHQEMGGGLFSGAVFAAGVAKGVEGGSGSIPAIVGHSRVRQG